MKRVLHGSLVLLVALVLAGGAAAETVDLPRPRLDGGLSVERAIAQRRTVREFAPAPLSLAQVGQLLWAAQGITRDDGRRTAPSAGARYPLQVYLVAGSVTGLTPGVYRYEPATQRLHPVAAGDRRADLASAAVGQSWIARAPAILVFGAIESRTTRKYGARGVRYVHMEAGHAAQNVLLQAESLGLAAAPVGAFRDERVAALVGLGRDERPLYLLPVGGRPPDDD